MLCVGYLIICAHTSYTQTYFINIESLVQKKMLFSFPVLGASNMNFKIGFLVKTQLNAAAEKK